MCLYMSDEYTYLVLFRWNHPVLSNETHTNKTETNLNIFGSITHTAIFLIIRIVGR